MMSLVLLSVGISAVLLPPTKITTGAGNLTCGKFWSNFSDNELAAQCKSAAETHQWLALIAATAFVVAFVVANLNVSGRRRYGQAIFVGLLWMAGFSAVFAVLMQAT